MLQGLFGKTVTLQTGDTVVVDEAYVRESILNPSAKVTAGFQPIMPTFQGVIPEDQLLELLAFIKALRPGGTPSRTEESVAPQSDPNDKEPKAFPKK